MIFIALALEALGLVFLYTAWRKPKRHTRYNLVAWALILSSLYPWVALMGMEYGISFFLLLMPLAAWPLVLKNGSIQKQKKKSNKAQHIKKHKTFMFKPKQWPHSTIKLMFNGLLTFIASFVSATLLSLACARIFGLVDSNFHVLNLSLLLVFWCASIVWMMTHSPKLKTNSALLLLTLSGSLWLYGNAHAYF